MTDRTLYAGLDPGGSGSWTLMEASGVIAMRHTFSVTEADIAIPFRAAAPFIRMAYIEKVASMPGQGVVSTFTFGQSYGFLRGLLAAFQIPFGEVRPHKWQSKMDCMTGGDKNVSKQRAQQLWPHLKWTHALADSALIAECCRRTFTRIGRDNSSDGDGDNRKPSPGCDVAGHRHGEASSPTESAIQKSLREFDEQ